MSCATLNASQFISPRTEERLACVNHLGVGQRQIGRRLLQHDLAYVGRSTGTQPKPERYTSARQCLPGPPRRTLCKASGHSRSPLLIALEGAGNSLNRSYAFGQSLDIFVGADLEQHPIG